MSEIPTAAREPGFLASLLGLYLSPSESFAAILKRPRVLAPLAVFLGLNVAFTAVWLGQVEPGEFVKAQLEEAGRWGSIPAESRAADLEGQGRAFPVFAWLGAILGPPVLVLVVSAVLLFVYRFFYAGEVTLPQALAVVAHAFLAVAVWQTPLTLLVLALKADWTIDPMQALQANPTLLLERDSVARPLYELLGSLDFFSFWIIGLLALGFGLAIGRPLRSALWGVVVPWVLVVAAKVAWAAL